MLLPWFKSRRYGHLDVPVGQKFAEGITPKFVASHSWSPLIRYMKRTKRYKPKLHKTEFKDRPIMFASHRDACILSKYAFELSEKLEKFYLSTGLSEHVIAYRSLGKSNYNFASVAREHAVKKAPCVALCFDISGFFDHLNHRQLKGRVKKVLDVTELPKDWFAVFREVTAHKWIEREHLASSPIFGARIKSPKGAPVATIAEVKAAKIPIGENSNDFGIPQGTPISSVFANIYMMDFDEDMSKLAHSMGALYQRYSDDILLICKEADRLKIIAAVEKSLLAQKLELSADKTEEVSMVVGGEDPFQYLGFYISYNKVYLRSPSIGRQWRKLRRGVRRTAKAGAKAVAEGKSTKVFTKKLRQRFSPTGAKNFSSYARRAADALGSDQIRKQVRRLERAADKAIRDLNK